MSLRVVLFAMLLLTLGNNGCSSCSKSGRGHKMDRAKINDGHPPKRMARSNTNIISMTLDGGVYLVPIEINGIAMKFIFDTGASDITMSGTEALFLYRQGKLADTDIIGTQQYRIADGSITEGTVINLRRIKIGNKILNNVKASIVHNLEAPLLLGQSALSKFGKVSIDYNRKEISFQ